jgi:hypothetical protein
MQALGDGEVVTVVFSRSYPQQVFSSLSFVSALRTDGLGATHCQVAYSA